MSNEQTEALSECNKCGRRYPSAPAGYIHKCGNCPGTCYPLATPSPAPSDTLREAFAAGFHAAEKALGFEGCDESEEALAIEWEEYTEALAARNTGDSHD